MSASRFPRRGRPRSPGRTRPDRPCSRRPARCGRTAGSLRRRRSQAGRQKPQNQSQSCPEGMRCSFSVVMCGAGRASRVCPICGGYRGAWSSRLVRLIGQAGWVSRLGERTGSAGLPGGPPDEHRKRRRAPPHGQSFVGHRACDRRDAWRALYRQPVPAQFGRRDRAQSRVRDGTVAGRTWISLQHLFLRLRSHANSAWRSARPLRAEALHAGLRGLHGAGLRAVCCCAGVRQSGDRAGAARLRHGLVPDGAVRALCALVSAGAVLDLDRHPARSRHARRAACDRAARFCDRVRSAGARRFSASAQALR